ncbi:MAG: sporulation protein YqfD, partial [Oscillospiraceae bacterium]|nr:sporulation protein YqfD [Oscillospiraceae bacterium]
HTGREKVFLNQQIATETGNTEKKHRFKINNFGINLNKPLSNFEKYDTISENRKIRIFSNFYLPISIETTTYKEYIHEDVTFTEQEAIDIAVQKIMESLLEQIENEENILNKQINTYGGQGYIEVEVIIEVLESIGIKQKI